MYTVSRLQAGSAYRFRVQEMTAYNASGYSGSIGIRSVTQSLERVSSTPVAMQTIDGCALSFSPDGRTLAVSDEVGLAVLLVDAATGAFIRTLPGRTHGWSLAFSPDGRWLAAGDMLVPPPLGQETTMEGRLWNVADGSAVTTFPGSPGVGAVAISPWGNLIALGHGGAVDVWASAGTWVYAP